MVGDVNRHASVLAQPLVDTAEQGAAASHRDAAVHDVAGQLRRALVERRPHGVNDHGERLGHRVPDLRRRHHDGLGQAAHQVPAADLRARLSLGRVGRSHGHLDLFRCPLTERERILLLAEVDDRLVELVAADPDRLRGHDAAERDNRDLGGASANVDDHVPGRLVDGQASADRRRHRLLDDVDPARTRLMPRFLHGALLDSGDSARYRDDDSRLGEPATMVNFLNEIAEHSLGDVKVGNDTVLQRTDGDDIARRAAYHALRFQSDCDYLPGIGIERYYRRFAQNDPAPSDIHQSVGGPQVDGHITAEKEQRVAHLLPYGPASARDTFPASRARHMNTLHTPAGNGAYPATGPRSPPGPVNRHCNALHCNDITTSFPPDDPARFRSPTGLRKLRREYT